MPNVRDTPYRKYNIGKYRFGELRNYALQYPEWKKELKFKYDTSKALVCDDMPHGSGGVSSPTEIAAMKCLELERKIETVEYAAKLSDPQLFEYILEAVTHEYVTYNYLVMHMNIPCSANTFYDRRRRFYWILSQNLENFGNQRTNNMII